MIRVAFLGNDAWSVPSLRWLDGADDVQVALVITNPPRPAGRGSELTPTAVAEEARALGAPLLEVDGVRSGEGMEALRRVGPDALVVVAYGELLSADVLDLPRLGSLNVHFSLLPRWRGAAPVQRAILQGDERTGVTVMLIDEGMDTGPILAAVEVPIEPEEDAGALGDRLAGLGGSLLVETLRGHERGSVEPRSQDHASATYAPKPARADREIDWSAPASSVVRRVRAFAPEPGATTTFRGIPLKVLRAAAHGPHGQLLDASQGSADGALVTNGAVRVQAGGATTVELVDVAPAGRKRMAAADWARGARIRPGERLG